MVVRIAGKRMYLWRAVDHEGEVLDMLVQRRRDKAEKLRIHVKQVTLPMAKISYDLGLSHGDEAIWCRSPVDEF
jgi:hypothetical protein